MPNQSRWKDFERFVAKQLNAQRNIRADYSLQVSDIIFKEDYLQHLVIDCKKRKNFKHHQLMNQISQKYCKNKKDIPILITKETRGRKFIIASMPFDFFKKLFVIYKKYLKENRQKN